MANVFTLTPGIDNFTGLSGDDNIFDFASSNLQSTDTITGGATGSFIDILRVTAAGTIAASQFAGVTNVEELLLSSGGNDVTLTNGVIAGSSIGYFAVVDGAGNDTVDASGVTNNVAVAFFASSGSDTFKGGNGNDAFAFNPANLTSADTVQGGAGVDNLYLNAAGTLAAGAFTNVTGIEGLVLANGTNNVTLTNGLVAGTSIGYVGVAGGTGNDTVDASAVSNSIPVAFFSNGGNDTFQGGKRRSRDRHGRSPAGDACGRRRHRQSLPDQRRHGCRRRLCQCDGV